MNRGVSATGNLDPCAQEFTPGAYTYLQAPPPPPPLPTPSAFYSYPLEVRPYIQPTAHTLAASIPAGATLSSPVLPLYNPTEVHLPLGSSISSISQHWENRPLQAHPGVVPGIQVQCSGSVASRATSNNRKFSSSLGASQGRSSPFLHGRGEHATRALLLSPVPSELSEAELRRQLEAWGPIRALDLNKLREGFITVLYYDIRHAKEALNDIQSQHLVQQRRLQEHYKRLLNGTEEVRNGDERNLPPPPPPPPPSASVKGLIGGKAIWAQYAIPVGIPPGPESNNQGTLVVFNLDANIDTNTIKSIFEEFGAVKELRETPSKRQHKFVEFFDVRDAARALQHMDGKTIAGKQVKIEFSRPAGVARRNPPLRTLSAPSLPPPPPPLPPAHFMQNHVHLPRPPPRWTKHPTWPLSSYDTSYRPVGSSTRSNALPHRHQNQQLQHDQNLGFKPTQTDNMPFRRRRPNGSQNQQEQHHPEVNAFLRARHFTKISNISNHGGRSGSSQFAFDEAKAESNSSDARTTVMIKNIPNKYSQQMLLSMLDQHCISCNERITDPNEPLSAYDFVYLPIDFKNKCNLGYAFVNMTTSKATWKFYKAFHKQPWEAFNSRKICEVTYARIQGRDALMQHFSNSKFACDTDEYLPLVFSPPRDGKQPFTYQAMGSSIASSTKNNATINQPPDVHESAQKDDNDELVKQESNIEGKGKEEQHDSKVTQPEDSFAVRTAGLSKNRNRSRTYQERNCFSSRRNNWSQYCTTSNGTWSERRRVGDLY